MSERHAIDRVDALTPEAVDRIATLARLELGEGERELYARHLTGILQHINKLAELDLDGVPPTSHAIPVANVTRADEPAASLDRDAALANAPEQEDGCFKVPQII